MVWKVPKKSLANSKNCSEFSKGKQFNQKFWKFQEENLLSKESAKTWKFHSPKNSGTIERKPSGTKTSFESFRKFEPFNQKIWRYRHGRKSMQREFPVRDFPNFCFISRGWLLFRTFRKMLLHSQLRIPGYSNRKFLQVESAQPKSKVTNRYWSRLILLSFIISLFSFSL